MGKKTVLMVAALVLFAPCLALAQTEWVEYENNPVVEAPDPDVWDDQFVQSVVEVDGTYHMYFNRSPIESAALKGYEICHATSTDGTTWVMDPANPVLVKGADGEWNDDAVFTPAVIHDGTGFRMWYSGDDGSVLRAGYATSPDGSVWTEFDGNPIIDVGNAGAFDDGGVLPGSVVVQGGLYRMWYWSGKNVGLGDYFWRVGYAESSDGLSWIKHPVPVLEPSAEWDSWLTYAPSVLFDGSTYHMWYTGTQGFGDYGIGYAVSDDGIEWVKHPGNPVHGFYDSDSLHADVLYDTDEQIFKMWYTGLDDGSYFSFGYATSECCVAKSFLSVVPAAAYSAGSEGSFFQTDVDLSNRGDQPVEFAMWWLPRGENNEDPIISETFVLAAGMGVRYTNILAEVFDLEPDALGALVIAASSSNLLAMSRTYNLAQTVDGGTFGQAMPAISLADMLASDERHRILFGSQNDAYRTNVGCINASDILTAVDVELFDAEGNSLSVERMRLDPWSNDQINRIFSDFAPINGWVDVSSPLPDATFYCYGSVLDNVTNDPTTILPQ